MIEEIHYMKEEYTKYFTLVVVNIKHREDITEHRKNKVIHMIDDYIEFINWIPDQDFFLELLLYRWKGYSNYKIGKMYKIRGTELKRIMLKRAVELHSEYNRIKLSERWIIPLNSVNNSLFDIC